MSVGGQSARLRLFPDQDFEFRFCAPSDANTILPHLRTRFPHARESGGVQNPTELSDSLLELPG